MYIYNTILAQLMICSSCKKHYDAIQNKPKLIIKHIIIVGMLENKESVGNHNKQIMMIIYQQSQAHNNLDHKFQTH